MSNIRKRELVVPWSMEPMKEYDEALLDDFVEPVSMCLFEALLFEDAGLGAVMVIFRAVLKEEASW